MLFSVIVPIYKVEAFLHKCVDSILVQTFDDFELILVDDGSPDNCPLICDEYARADGRVRVIHKPNGGLVSARNTGLRAVRGEYVCYVDGDDWVAPNWLETIHGRIEASPERPDLVVFGAVKVFDDHTEAIVHNLPDGFYSKQQLETEVYPYLISDRRFSAMQGIVSVSAWTKAYRRELVQEHFCRDERITLGEDNAFTIECFLAAESAASCSDVLYYYNQMNCGSMMSAYNPNRFRAYLLLFRYLSERLKGKGASIDAQMNDCYADFIAMGVFHEVQCGRPINQAARHIAQELHETSLLDYVTIRGLRPRAKIFIRMLSHRAYGLTLLGAKLWLKLKKRPAVQRTAER